MRPSAEKWNAIRRATGKGGRVCFIDFIEYDNGFIRTKTNSTLWIFSGKSAAKDPDYHHKFDCSWFYHYMTKHFLPVYREVYWERHAFIFMDNAQYHKCAIGRKRLTVKSGKGSLKKKEMIELWKKLGIDAIHVDG